MKAYIVYPFAAVVTFVVGFGIAAAAGACLPVIPCKAKVTAIPEKPINMHIPESVDPSPLDRSKDSYKVYSAVLGKQWKSGSIGIRSKTDAGLFANDQWLDNNVGNLSPEAVADFKKANQDSLQLVNRFDYDGKLVLIDPQEFKTTIGGGDGWDVFKKAHAGATGIVTFSAVGFDSKGTNAIVNVSFVCPGPCASGNVFVLNKKDGNWTVSKQIEAFIS